MTKDAYIELRREFELTFPQSSSYGMNLTTLIPTGETRLNPFTRETYNTICGIQWWENGGLNIENWRGFIDMACRNPDGSWEDLEKYRSFCRDIDPDCMMDSYEPLVRYLIHKKAWEVVE